MKSFTVLFNLEYARDSYGTTTAMFRVNGVDRHLMAASIQEALKIASECVGQTIDYEFDVYNHAGEFKPARVVEITGIRLDGKGL